MPTVDVDGTGADPGPRRPKGNLSSLNMGVGHQRSRVSKKQVSFGAPRWLDWLNG